MVHVASKRMDMGDVWAFVGSVPLSTDCHSLVCLVGFNSVGKVFFPLNQHEISSDTGVQCNDHVFGFLDMMI